MTLHGEGNVHFITVLFKPVTDQTYPHCLQLLTFCSQDVLYLKNIDFYFKGVAENIWLFENLFGHEVFWIFECAFLCEVSCFELTLTASDTLSFHGISNTQSPLVSMIKFKLAKVTVVNWTLASLNRGSLEILLIISFKWFLV